MTNKRFLLHLVAMLGVVVLLIFGILQWLKIYTHHGEKLETPNYVGVHIQEAEDDAERRSFQIVIHDSVHIVGKPGGLVHIQNPPAGAMVKQNRKIYVTLTKYTPDEVNIATIFPLYGQDYEAKRKQLEQLAIASEIKEFKYDPLTTGTILEVWHNGRRIIDKNLNPQGYDIARGDKLEFVVSNPEGGEHVVPNLVGMPVSQARWVAANVKLALGTITTADGVNADNANQAVIIAQEPTADGTTTLTTGAPINVVVKLQ